MTVRGVLLVDSDLALLGPLFVGFVVGGLGVMIAATGARQLYRVSRGKQDA